MINLTSALAQNIRSAYKNPLTQDFKIQPWELDDLAAKYLLLESELKCALEPQTERNEKDMQSALNFDPVRDRCDKSF